MAALQAALDLVGRLPPEHVVKTLGSLIELAPELQEDLLSCVDQPLQAPAKGGEGGDSLRLLHARGAILFF